MNAQAVSRRVLRALCGRLAPETRVWGDAILAEFEFVGDGRGSVSWAMGGATVMMRLLLRQWIRSSTMGFSEGTEGRPPWRWSPLVLVALAFALLLSPDFRQGVSLVVSSLRPIERAVPPNRNLDEIARRAEQNHDARLLAAAALAADDATKQARWADQAIALDPSLTWIQYPVATRGVYSGTRDAYSGHERTPEQQRAQLDDASRRAALLQAWDPGNAVPYLLEAEIALQKSGAKLIGPRAEVTAAMEKLPEWRAAMDRAFIAPHYDSYLDRHFVLLRDTVPAFGGDGPLRMFLALAAHPIPNLMSIRQYANWLIGDAAYRLDPKRLPGGRWRVDYASPLAPGVADPKRTPQYWEAALFGQRMQLESKSEIEKLIGIAIEQPADRALRQLLADQGRREEALAMQHRLQQLDLLQQERMGRGPQAEFYSWQAILTDVAFFIAFASAGLLLLALLYAAERRWRPQHAVRYLDQFACVVFRYAPATLLTSSVAFYLFYRPYADALRRSMRSAGFREFDGGLADVLGGFWNTPWHNLLQSSQAATRAYYTSWAVLIALVLLLGWRFARVFYRPTRHAA